MASVSALALARSHARCHPYLDLALEAQQVAGHTMLVVQSGGTRAAAPPQRDARPGPRAASAQTTWYRARRPVADGPHDDETVARVDLPCRAAGFAPPPCPLEVRLRPAGEGWEVHVASRPGRAHDVAHWLDQYAPATVHVASGLAPRDVAAWFPRLPDTWSGILALATVRSIHLTPQGTASFFVEDAARAVDRLVGHLRHDAAFVRSRPALLDHDQALTPRQQEALSLAVALGYYDVPRRLNLRELARRLELSAGATSELLRRGERVVVIGHVDRLSAPRSAGRP